jgi:hypothetical protein
MIEEKVVDVRDGSRSVISKIQPTDEYQNTTLSAETNKKLKIREIMKEKKDTEEISKGYIVNEKNDVAYFSGKYYL